MVKIIIPIRCFSCGKVIGDSYEKYAQECANNKNPGKVLDELGVKKYCCRRMIVSHADLMDEFLKYKI